MEYIRKIIKVKGLNLREIMSQEINVRKMRLEDLLGVIRVCNQAFREAARITSYIAPQLLESLIKQPEAQLVAEVEGKIVGFLRGEFVFKERKAIVAHIAVHPKYQGKGIGGKLIRHFEKLAKEKGLRKVSLGTPFARGFYEKLGYKCTKITYAVVYDLVGKEVVMPKIENFKVIDPITLDHITIIANSLTEKEVYNCLIHYFDLYKVPCKSSTLILDSNNKILGIVLGKEHTWIKDLLTVTYLYGSTLWIKTWLLKFMAYKASLLGLRYLGIRTDDNSLIKELLKEGWEIKSFDTFWTGYTMEKILT